jgi:hypothetical protein
VRPSSLLLPVSLSKPPLVKSRSVIAQASQRSTTSTMSSLPSFQALIFLPQTGLLLGFAPLYPL